MQIYYYKNQIVRDLAWILSTTPLIENSNKLNTHFLTTEFLKEEFEKFKLQLNYYDENPDELISFIKENNTHLLGKYFENLVKFWLLKSEDKELIASNIQIRNKSRTIGELDFIYRDLNYKKVYHLEAAGKFYMAYNNENDWKNFIGPNTNDIFHNKLQKLINEQSELIYHPAANEKLNELGIDEEVHPIVLLKGYLFYHYKYLEDNTFVIPELATENHPKGWWIHSNEVREFLVNKNSQWKILERMKWISRVVYPDNKKLLKLNELYKKLDKYFSNNTYPLIVVELSEDENNNLIEASRGFIVSGNWPFIKTHKMIDKIA